MIKIQVLGPGCTKCNVLYEHADRAARELGLEYEIEKVSDIAVIMGFGVMTTPALVVNGQVKLSGRVPSSDQLKEVLS
ncbi:MAG: TM0996/MTH895 family glutaredoxin-like protein [Candidatus Eisenbacteria bacterium]|nr:TM0996/MTH895 family glutaredoxin-like protein [Candidatus Eisenbacteria bacterium]